MNIDDLDALSGKPSRPCANLGKIRYVSDGPKPIPLDIPIWMSDLLDKVTDNGIPRDELLRCWIVSGLTKELRARNRGSKERREMNSY